MDGFDDILSSATDKANQTYATDTASADAAQAQANQQFNSVNSEGDLANQTAAQLDALGTTDANTTANDNTYQQEEQSQLNTMGFDKDSLGAASNNINQETGQLADANNQIAAQGGTRGFNAIGEQNRVSGIQANASNAIGANNSVQSNELAKANTAATFTGQENAYQQSQQANAVSALNDTAAQQNNTMANYATSLNTLAQQATTYGGLVGSNIANIMASASSAADALYQKYNAQVAVAQAGELQSQSVLNYANAGLANANTALSVQQKNYNVTLEGQQNQAYTLTQENVTQQKKQIASLESTVNDYNGQIEKYQSNFWNIFNNPLAVPNAEAKVQNVKNQINTLTNDVYTGK